MKKLIVLLLILTAGVPAAFAMGSRGTYSGYGKCIVEADNKCGVSPWVAHLSQAEIDAYNACRLPGEIACAKKFNVN